MGIFKYRHIIAKFILIQFLFILLLSVHFTAWRGIYTEDGLSLECIVDQGRYVIEEGSDRLTLSTVCLEHSIVNLWVVALSIIGLFCPFFFVLFFLRINQKIFYEFCTLVSLSVRLNN